MSPRGVVHQEGRVSVEREWGYASERDFFSNIGYLRIAPHFF